MGQKHTRRRRAQIGGDLLPKQKCCTFSRLGTDTCEVAGKHRYRVSEKFATPSITEATEYAVVAEHISTDKCHGTNSQIVIQTRLSDPAYRL